VSYNINSITGALTGTHVELTTAHVLAAGDVVFMSGFITLVGSNHQHEMLCGRFHTVDMGSSVPVGTTSQAAGTFHLLSQTSLAAMSSPVGGKVKARPVMISGSNLKLTKDFYPIEDSTITLVCDGTDWFEIARSHPRAPTIDEGGGPLAFLHPETVGGTAHAITNRLTIPPGCTTALVACTTSIPTMRVNLIIKADQVPGERLSLAALRVNNSDTGGGFGLSTVAGGNIDTGIRSGSGGEVDSVIRLKNGQMCTLINTSGGPALSAGRETFDWHIIDHNPDKVDPITDTGVVG
jgi:hypothetical protein